MGLSETDLSVDDLPSFPSERYSIDYSFVQVCCERLRSIINVSAVSRILSWEERGKAPTTSSGRGVQEGLTIDNCLYSGFSSLSPSPLPSRQSSARNVINFVCERMLEHSAEGARGGGWGCDSTSEKKVATMLKGRLGALIVLDLFWWIYLKQYGLNLAASPTSQFEEAAEGIRDVFDSLKDRDGCISDEDLRRILFQLGAIDLDRKAFKFDDGPPARVSQADFEDLMLRRSIGDFSSSEVNGFIDQLFRRISLNICELLFAVDLATRDLVSNVLIEALYMCTQRAFFECFISQDCRQRTGGSPFLTNMKKWIVRSMTGVPVAETSTLKTESKPYGAAIAASVVPQRDALQSTLSFSSPTAPFASSRRKLQTQDSFVSHVNRVRSFKQQQMQSNSQNTVKGPASPNIQRGNTSYNGRKVVINTANTDFGTFVQEEDCSDEGSLSGSHRIASAALSVRVSTEQQSTARLPARVTTLPTGSHFVRDNGVEDLMNEFKQLHKASRAKFQKVRKELQNECKDSNTEGKKAVFEQLSHYPRWFEGKHHRDAVRATPKMTKWDSSSFSPCMQVYLNERGNTKHTTWKSSGSHVSMEIVDPDEPKVNHDYKKRAEEIRERIKQLGHDEPNPEVLKDIKKREMECRKELHDECEKLKRALEVEKATSKAQFDSELSKIWKVAEELNAAAGNDDARLVAKLTATCNAIDNALNDSRTSFTLRNKLWNMTCKLKPRLDYLLRIENWHERSLQIPDESLYNIDEEFDNIMKDMGSDAKRKQKERMAMLQKTAFLDPLESNTMLGEILKQNYRMYIENEKFCTEL